MGTIQLLQITPEQLQQAILDGVKKQLEDLKRDFQPKEPNIYMTRSEVASMLKIDLSTVHNWAKSGKLKPYGIGSRVYFKKEEVENSIIKIR